MGLVKIGVVEDEAVIADHISDTLESLGYLVTEPALNYTEAMEMVEDESPDLLLLDIQLAGSKDGVDVARTVSEKYDIPFIFLTANADSVTVDRAKEVKPSAYLVKPFNKDDLYTSIEICLANKASATIGEPGQLAPDNVDQHVIDDSIFIKDATTFRKVKFSDILYLKSDHVYVEVHTRGKNYVVRTTMKDFLPKFGAANFFQVHRSFAVNLDHVNGISHVNVEVGTEQIPIGKTYRNELLGKLNLT